MLGGKGSEGHVVRGEEIMNVVGGEHVGGWGGLVDKVKVILGVGK